jgi:adenylate cyclase class IV
MIEIELKCELSPELLEQVHRKVREMEFLGTGHNHDIYYDTPTWDLLRRAIFVRVRNGRQLEFKYNEAIDPEHRQANERVFPLPSSPAEIDRMNALFSSFLPAWRSASSFEEARQLNDLSELVTIDNTRQAYASEHIAVSIDHVEGLGDFLEIETNCEEGTDTSQAEARLHTFVSNLPVQHIRVGYVELWLAKHNPAAYEVGQYHL